MLRFLSALLLAAAPVLAAPVPVQITHSGYLLGASDAPLDAPTQGLTFTVYDGLGASVWTATCTVAVTHGYYAITLGAPSCGPALTTAHVPPNATRLLEISVGATALTPRLALTSAPTAGLALEATHATDADSLGGIAASAWQQRTGDGSGLTDLNASELTTGTLPNARLANVPDTALASNGDLAKLAGDQTFTGAKTFAPSAGTVPFAVGAGRTGLVAGLNADQVDGVSLPASAVACSGGQVVNGLSVASGTLGVSCQAVASGSTTATGVQVFASGAQPACTAGNAGGLYFDSTTKVFYACDGVNPFWRALAYATSTWAPTAVSGLFSWFDATEASSFTFSSGALVQQWAGKAGFGNGAIQMNTSLQPTRTAGALNGLPIVAFTPSQVLRFNPTSALTQVSVFTVYKLPGAGTGYPVTFGGTNNVTGQYHGLELLNDANALDVFGGFGNDSRATLAGIASFGAGAPYQVIDWTSTSSHGTTAWANGTQATMSTTGSNVSWNFVLGTGSSSDIGGMGCQAGGCVATNLAELLVYSRIVTSTERQQIEGYLAWKWGLQGSLAATHPYKNAGP